MELQFTDAAFDKDVLKSSKPVVVDFWAPWCGPCRMLGPLVQELAGEYAGKVLVGKMNTDDNPAVASRYNISAIPTMLFFKGGEVVDQMVGVHSKGEIKAKLDIEVAGASASAVEAVKKAGGSVVTTFKKKVHVNKKGAPGKRVQRRVKSAEKRAAQGS